MHPLVGDISEMKDADIEAKIYDLTNKYFNTRNPDIKAEIILYLDTYNAEIERRKVLAWQKTLETPNKNLDKLIKVN